MLSHILRTVVSHVMLCNCLPHNSVHSSGIAQFLFLSQVCKYRLQTHRHRGLLRPDIGACKTDSHYVHQACEECVGGSPLHAKPCSLSVMQENISIQELEVLNI